MLQNRRRHLLPPWASLRSGARLDLRLLMLFGLCWFELGTVPEHGVHDDRETTGKGDPCLAHRRSFGDCECPVLELQRPLVAGQYDVRGLVQECANPSIAALRDAAGVVNLA